MAEVSIVKPELLDFSAFEKLQQEAFAEVIGDTVSGALQTAAYYRWKYCPPSGPAVVAIVHDETGLLAANSMFPLTVTWKGRDICGWQSCDTATLPRARGKGYFMKCLGALKSQLGEDEIFFGFPNKNSAPGFVKFGWTHRADVRTWVRVLPGRRLSFFRQVHQIEEFGPEWDDFSVRYGLSGNPTLVRDSAYLNWRYRKHPHCQYTAFRHDSEGEPDGLLVMRKTALRGLNLAIAMELISLNTRTEAELINCAAAWARDQKLQFTLLINNTTVVLAGLAGAYLPVPARLLPKRQMLMGAATGQTASQYWAQNWRVQIGDWDGF